MLTFKEVLEHLTSLVEDAEETAAANLYIGESSVIEVCHKSAYVFIIHREDGSALLESDIGDSDITWIEDIFNMTEEESFLTQGDPAVTLLHTILNSEYKLKVRWNERK